MDQHLSTPISEEKYRMHVDNDNVDDNNRLIKSQFLGQRRPWRLTSFILPSLLGLLLVVGVILLILTLTRRTTCDQLQAEQAEALLGYKPDEHVTFVFSSLQNEFDRCSLDENMGTMCETQGIISMRLSGIIYPFLS